MRKLINYIDKNLLLKIASLNSISVIIRVMVGFLTSKALALYVGPSGMALVGNLRDFLTSTRAFATLGFNNGIVKYISELRNDFSEMAKKISTVLYTVISLSLLLSILIYFNSNSLNDWIFDGHGEYAFIFKVLAVALPFYSLNIVFMAVLNGSSKFKYLLNVSIVGQLVTGMVTIILIWLYTIEGALVALIISELLVLLILLIGLKDSMEYRKFINLKYFDFNSLKDLSAFSIMALFTASTLPLTYLFIRNYIAENVGLDDSGYWQAMNRVSNYYLMFITSLLSLYILPRLSVINNSNQFRLEIINFYKNVIPVFGLGLIIIYFLREYLILIIFTEDFMEMKSLFFWQMLGDFIKVLSLVISYQLLAKRMLLSYLITEALSISILIVSSIYLINIYGTVGATMAHCLTYIIYLLVMLFLFRRQLFGKNIPI